LVFQFLIQQELFGALRDPKESNYY
jgi:hypothetical protein